MFQPSDLAAMEAAFAEAAKCEAASDVPVGALVLDSIGQVIGRGHNSREANLDPTAHAEVLAIRAAAAAVGSWRLDGCTLVVTLEPCVMCAGAILNARINRVVFAADEPKTGAAGSLTDVLRDPRALHQVEVVRGVMAVEAAVMLGEFFKNKRA